MAAFIAGPYLDSSIRFYRIRPGFSNRGPLSSRQLSAISTGQLAPSWRLSGGQLARGVRGRGALATADKAPTLLDGSLGRGFRAKRLRADRFFRTGTNSLLS